MADEFGCGFEGFLTGVSGELIAGNRFSSFTGGFGTVTAAAARTGAQGLNMPAGTELNLLTLPVVTERWYHFAFRVPTLPLVNSRIFAWFLSSDGSNYQGCCEMSPTGQLEIWRGQSTGPGGTRLIQTAAVFAALTYYQLGIRYRSDNATGFVDVRLNGSSTPLATFSGDTQQLASPNMDSIRIFGGNHGCDFDDVLIASHEDFADWGAYPRMAIADSSVKQWTPSAGTDHFAMIDENPSDEDVTYNESTVIGNIDRCQLEATPSNRRIRCVSLIVRLRKTDAGGRTARASILSGATAIEGADIAVPPAYAHFAHMQSTDPATGAAWTVAGRNMAFFGQKDQG